MASLPKEQWAQVVEKTGGPVVYKKIPVPKPGPDEVLVNIKYSGVCHTDLHAMQGDWPLVSHCLLLCSLCSQWQMLIFNPGHQDASRRRT